MKSKLPNFLIVGSTKAGTTSLYNYLQQHENVYLNKGIKETNFFVEPKKILGCGPRFFGENSYVKDATGYEKLFNSVDLNKHVAVGEVCTTYLHFSSNTIPNIKKYLVNPKIIIILRNPIDRAFSYYMHNVRDGDEDSTFEDALQLEEERKKENLWLSFRLKELGNYTEHVKNYIDNFSNVKVILYDEMRSDMNKTMSDIFNFLGVDEMSVDSTQKFNISGIPKNRFLHNMVHGNNWIFKVGIKLLELLIGKSRLKKIQNNIDSKNLEKTSINQNTREMLSKYYRDEVADLSSLIGKDLKNIWNIRA